MILEDGFISKKEYTPLMLEMVAWKIIYYTYIVIPYFITNNI